jgi:hypothetical protein
VDREAWQIRRDYRGIIHISHLSGTCLPTADAWMDEVGLAVEVDSREHHLCHPPTGTGPARPPQCAGAPISAVAAPARPALVPHTIEATLEPMITGNPGR